MNCPGMTTNYPIKSVLWFVFIYPGNGHIFSKSFLESILLHDLVFQVGTNWYLSFFSLGKKEDSPEEHCVLAAFVWSEKQFFHFSSFKCLYIYIYIVYVSFL